MDTKGTAPYGTTIGPIRHCLRQRQAECMISLASPPGLSQGHTMQSPAFSSRVTVRSVRVVGR